MIFKIVIGFIIGFTILTCAFGTITYCGKEVYGILRILLSLISAIVILLSLLITFSPAILIIWGITKMF